MCVPAIPFVLDHALDAPRGGLGKDLSAQARDHSPGDGRAVGAPLRSFAEHPDEPHLRRRVGVRTWSIGNERADRRERPQSCQPPQGRFLTLTTSDFDVGVWLLSAKLPSGTRTLPSGKYVAAHRGGIA